MIKRLNQNPSPSTFFNQYNPYRSRKKSVLPSIPSQKTSSEFYNSTKSSLNSTKPKASPVSRAKIPTNSRLAKKMSPLVYHRTSSQATRTIFESSSYIKNSFNNSPIVFEVSLNTVCEPNLSFDTFYPDFKQPRQVSANIEEFSSRNSEKHRITKKINLEKFKETERMAAEIIQKAWKQFTKRKAENEALALIQLKKAEKTAKAAVEEYEQLRKQAEFLTATRFNMQQ